MATGRRERAYDALTPEQKAKVDAFRESRNAPGVMEAEVRDREALREEYRTTGKIETMDSAWAEDEIRLLGFLSRLKKIRQEAGLSLAEVAERSNIDLATLSGFEDGKGNPTARELSRYCHGLGGRITWGFEKVGDVGDPAR